MSDKKRLRYDLVSIMQDIAIILQNNAFISSDTCKQRYELTSLYISKLHVAVAVQFL